MMKYIIVEKIVY